MTTMAWSFHSEPPPEYGATMKKARLLILFLVAACAPDDTVGQAVNGLKTRCEIPPAKWTVELCRLSSQSGRPLFNT